MKSIAVVGTSIAGWRAAQELREQGFDGRLVMIGEESHRPYDRPVLSKDFLTDGQAADELALATEKEEDALDAEWRPGTRAIGLRPRQGCIALDDGTTVAVDGAVLATGARPITLPGTEQLGGVHYLRTLEQARALRTELAPDTRVVVIGGGLIGTEIASACRSRGARVTLVEAQHMPLARTLGIELAPTWLALHEEHCVHLRCGTPASRVLGRDRATGVELADGRVLPADLVVVEVGSRPTTEWLRGSGVKVRDGVVTSPGGVTAVPNVVAVGDLVRHLPAQRGRTARSDHWWTAMNQPPVAVRNLLAGWTVSHYAAIPRFWSRQYGNLLQFAGFSGPKDKVRVVDGSLHARRFVATYHRGGRTVAVCAFNNPKAFSRYRRRLSTALRQQ
ncbi:NAD(P)/FAD-dependent oxidoreductase [Bounagaea algeriensis]